MPKEKEKTKDSKDLELILKRLLNAPIELVWKAWTDPEQVAQWWGPNNFTIPLCKMDVKPGGALLIHMKAPDGTIYPMNGSYKELVKPERIVFAGAALDTQGNALFEQVTSILFEKDGNKTKLNIKVTFSKVKPEAAGHIAGAEIGWNQMMDKLLIYIEPFVFERTLNAPVARVWKAISDKNEMKKWYFDLTEFTPEAGFEFQFRGGKDPSRSYLHLCKIIEAIPEKKLSYSWKYNGYAGSSLVTFELFEEGTKTRLRLTHSGLETFPASNQDFIRGNFAEGWTHIIGTSLKEFIDKQ